MHFCSIENKLTIGKQTHTDIRGRDTYSGNFVSIFEYKRPPILLNLLHLYILQSTKWLRKWQFTRLDWFFKYCLGCNSSIYISISGSVLCEWSRRLYGYARVTGFFSEMNMKTEIVKIMFVILPPENKSIRKHKSGQQSRLQRLLSILNVCVFTVKEYNKINKDRTVYFGIDG